MSRFGKWPGVLGGGICGMFLVAGCSSATQHKWLTVFFDGVPSPRRATAPGPAGPPPMVVTNLPPVQAATNPGPALVVHVPYGERNCVACHASNYSQRLKEDLSTLCTGCHKALRAPARFVHAPVADGQCTLCHTAHQAKEKFRLVKESRELCLDCHAPEEVLRIRACSESTDRLCTGCHDPHQENRRFLLRASADKLPLVPNRPSAQ